MANIGIAISGRKPGFQNFVLIGWEGTPPQDGSYLSRVAGEVYYSATLGPEYSVYERVLCRFNPGDGRINALKYSIQVPTGALILQQGCRPVSPKYILDAIAATVEGDVIVREGAMWRFRPGQARPVFPVEQMQRVVSELTLKAMWGGSAVMQGLNSPYFVECADADIPNYMMHLPLMPSDRLAMVSQLAFGHFNGTDRLFTFTAEDMDARPPMRIHVVCDKNDFTNEMSDDAVLISTKALGYDPECYHEESFRLAYADIIKAYYTGEGLPELPWISFDMNAATATVTANIAPVPISKTFTYTVEGVKTDLARDKVLDNLGYRDAKGNFVPVTRDFTVSGDKIKDFDAIGGRPITEYFQLSRDSGCELMGVRIVGDRIVVKVMDIVVAEPQRKHMPADQAPAAGCVLRVVLPAALKGTNYWLFVTSSVGNGDETSTVVNARFQPGDGNMIFEKQFESMLKGSVTVSLGSPAKYRTQALRTADDTPDPLPLYLADLNKAGTKTGFFSRLAELFRFSDSDYCGIGSRMARVAIIIMLFFMVFLAGGLLGGTITTFFTGYFNSSETEAPETEDIVSDEAEEGTPAYPAATHPAAPAPVAATPQSEPEPEAAPDGAEAVSPAPASGSVPVSEITNALTEGISGQAPVQQPEATSNPDDKENGNTPHQNGSGLTPGNNNKR